MRVIPIMQIGYFFLLFAISVRVFAGQQDAQKMFDLILKNAPPELKQKMDAARRRQAEETRNPTGKSSRPAGKGSGPVDLARFVRGNWVLEPFKANCETGRVGVGPSPFKV